MVHGGEVTPDGRIFLAKGQVDPGLMSVYALVNNEMFYLPAFLDRYRQLGIGQFIFLDDRSDDGTFEYLSSQPDCVIARSELRYGDRVGDKRAVHIWKTEIPRHFLPGQWVICVDADELLFIPPRYETLDAFTKMLDQHRVTAVGGVMVDFYPETVDQMEKACAPQNCSELFSSYPWFDAGPYFRWTSDRKEPTALHLGVQDRLLAKFDISKRHASKSGLRLIVHKLKSALFGKSYVKASSKLKVPLIKWVDDRFFLNSHSLNIAPDRDILLAIAHFKFTNSLYEKIGRATSSRAYSDGSRAYFEYRDLLAAMKADDGSFLCERSRKFSNASDFEETGLMMCEL